MDSEKQEQAFDAMYMAIQLGRKQVAQRVFDHTLESYCKGRVNRVASKLTGLAQRMESADYSPTASVTMKLCAWELMDIIEELTNT